jgi:hypothetical protein
MRFNIRDLLWLMFVVALAAGWWTDRRDTTRQRFDDRARIAAQEQALEAKDAHIATIQARLDSSRADEKVLREELAEFIATQEDKLKVDVGAGLFYRLSKPK